MSIALFDASAGCGGTKPGSQGPESAAELAAEMTRLSIGRALVRIEPVELDTEYSLSLSELYRLCKAHPSFVPCPVVIPAGGGDVPPEREQVDVAIRAGAGAAVIRPGCDGWCLEAWCSGPLFAALEERRLPVFCLLGQTPYPALAAVAERFPALPLLLAGVEYRDGRMLVPFLQRFGNVHLVTGGRFCTHHGLEQLARAAGAERILFGTGWPGAEAVSAITYLTYSNLSGREKALVGSGNLERLIGEIRR